MNLSTSTKTVPVSDNQLQLILSAQVGLFFFSFFFFLMIYYCQRRMVINHSSVFPSKSGATAGLFLKQIVNSKLTEFSFLKKAGSCLFTSFQRFFFFLIQSP